jgi:UDP-sugar transporter A1/2/3
VSPFSLPSIAFLGEPQRLLHTVDPESSPEEHIASNMALSSQFLNSPQFKLILLTAMVLQNSCTVLVGRYTRSSVPVSELYVVNHLIVICEIGKLLLSCVFEYFTTNGQLRKSIQSNIIDRPYDALKIMVPALLYLVQNSLLYVALSNLTAPIFQVTYQAKLVTTAIVSVFMLNRKYSPQQWICLVLLSLGVAIVVLGETGDSKKDTVIANQSLSVGLTAVTIACLSSALAGVYFEKVIKAVGTGDKSGDKSQAPVSVWMRNIQLAFFTICTAIFQGLWQGANADTPQPYFHGFTGWVWFLVCLQAGGGLLVAAVIKYADNVLKGLATGVSVCFATACSTIFLGTPLSGQFSVGATLILTSVYFFSNPFKKDKKDKKDKKAESSSPASPSESEMKVMLPKV